MQIVPDEPTEVIEQQVPEPAPEPVPEPVAAIEEPAPEPEPVPEPIPEPRKATPSVVPLRILQERVGEVTRKKDQEIEDRDRKIRGYEEILQRMQKGDTTADPPAQRQPAQGDQSFESAVQTVVTQREAARQINELVRTARAEFPADWSEKADILGAVGAGDPEFVLDVIAADPKNAHKILYSLAQTPDRAADLAAMDMRSRTAELTRMSMAEQAKTQPKAAEPVAVAKAALSRAPAPAPRVAPNSPGPDVDPTTPEGNDKMSDKAFESWYKAKYMQRA